jgi:multidrug efflux system outer membrane protein
MNRSLYYLGSICSFYMLAACAVGPDYTPPSIQETGNWLSDSEAAAHAGTPAQNWWAGFNDTTLNQLMDETAANNYDIAIALANIDRARALRRSALAPFFPQIDMNADATRQSFAEATSRNRFFAEKERDSFNAFLDAAWEIDIFGRTRRANEAAKARLQAATENRNSVVLAALAETAQSYFSVRGLQKRILVMRHNIELLREVEDVAKSQFDAGITTEFDYTTAVGERQQVEAQLPALEADLASATYRLSVLAGKEPGYYAELLRPSAELPAPPDVVALGLRSELLRRRPDVRLAERTLAASSADIGVAIGDLFPRLTLTGSIGSSALVGRDVLTSGGLNHSVGALLNLPIFQGGVGWAAVNLSKADNRAALLNYQQAVLLALEDAESSLVRYDKELETLHLQQQAEAQRKEAYRIARLRYESGEESFLVMLDAERSLVSAQDATIQSEIRILTYLTQLYKALGGGWQEYANAPIQTEKQP